MPRPSRNSGLFHLLFKLIAFASLGGELLHAETIDYHADATLATTMVKTEAFQPQPRTLAEVITALEAQTSLRFMFDADRLPMGAEVQLAIGQLNGQSLAQILEQISTQVAVIFKRRNNLIAVWSMGPDDVIVASDKSAPPVVAPMFTIPTGESPAAAAEQTPTAGAPSEQAAPTPMFTMQTGESPPATSEPTPEADTAAATQPDFSTAARPGEVLLLDKISVQGETVKGSSADLRANRQKAEVAVDFLSADQIAKYSAGDLADVVFRIPGVSVAGGQFAVIRGLSDRYTNTTLNGLKLPSPDPEKQSPQLDILPTSLIDSIVVYKSFAPFLWADTSGGSIDLANEGVSSERRLSLSYGIKVHEGALDGGPRYNVPDRKNDWLASGSKSRPDASPEAFRAPWDYVPQHEDLPLGQKFAINYHDGFLVADRQVGFNLAAAYDLTSSQRIGQKQVRLVGHTDNIKTLANSEYGTGEPTLLNRSTWDYAQSKVEATVTGLASMGVKLSDDHELRMTAFGTRTGSDIVTAHISPLANYRHALPNGNIVETQVGVDQGEQRLGVYGGSSGFLGPQAIERHRDIQVYSERKLAVFQTSGDHKFSSLGDLQLKWVAQQTSTYQNEPNLIDARYYFQLAENPATTEFKWLIPVGEYGLPPSGQNDINRFWGRTHESQSAYRIDGEWPALAFLGRNARLRFGLAKDNTNREFVGSSFTGIFNTLSDAKRTGTEVDELFYELVNNYQTDPNRGSSEQARRITASYLNLSVELPANVELNVGARLEQLTINTEGTDNVNHTATAKLYYGFASRLFGNVFKPDINENEPLATAFITKVNFADLRWYPSVSLAWRPTETVVLRSTFSQTSARPSLREMGPYYNRSLDSGEYVVGNPFLQPSEVTNLDFRAEWNRKRTSRLAVSLFAKEVKQPIEKVFLPVAVNGEGVETWVNNNNTADLMGAELEFLQELGGGFTLGGNFTWIKAEVEENIIAVESLRADAHLAADETVYRPLYDQPEYIANLDLTWSAPSSGTSVTVAVYAISDVLESTGTGISTSGNTNLSITSLDQYERAYHRLDLSVSQALFAGLKLKFNAANLTDPVLGTIYDPSRTPGELNRNAYRAGRNYSLTLSKNF